MQELVEWATVAYRSNPNATDADIEALLVHHGFGRRFAWRATAMLPLAFGRMVLKGLVTLPSTYLEGGIEHELEADPVFFAAMARANHAARGDLERIGLRSAEVNAVNAALNAGSKAEDLLLSSPVLMDPTSGADADAPSPGDRAQRMVDELRSAHGSALACRARLFPSKLTTAIVQLQVDLDTTSPRLGERFVRESFAGNGATIEAAVGDAIKKFAASSFHVLMATLEAEPLGGNQVEWENWGPFRVCMGSLLRQWSPEPPIDFGPYVDALKAELLAASLPATLHWYRTWFAFDHELHGFDALLDNDDFTPGATLIGQWPWPHSERQYALRHFVMLVPA